MSTWIGIKVSYIVFDTSGNQYSVYKGVANVLPVPSASINAGSLVSSGAVAIVSG
jgi:hypothetical protein